MSINKANQASLPTKEELYADIKKSAAKDFFHLKTKTREIRHGLKVSFDNVVSVLSFTISRERVISTRNTISTRMVRTLLFNVRQGDFYVVKKGVVEQMDKLEKLHHDADENIELSTIPYDEHITSLLNKDISEIMQWVKLQDHFLVTKEGHQTVKIARLMAPRLVSTWNQYYNCERSDVNLTDDANQVLGRLCDLMFCFSSHCVEQSTWSY